MHSSSLVFSLPRFYVCFLAGIGNFFTFESSRRISRWSPEIPPNTINSTWSAGNFGFSGGNSIDSIGIPSEIMASGVGTAFDWWNEANRSPLWQDRIFHTLAGLFGFVAAVALVISLRSVQGNSISVSFSPFFGIVRVLESELDSSLFLFRSLGIEFCCIKNLWKCLQRIGKDEKLKIIFCFLLIAWKIALNQLEF